MLQFFWKLLLINPRRQTSIALFTNLVILIYFLTSAARRLRKTLGGGMRQVGVITSAAYVALRDNASKLKDDHKNAKILADGLNQIKQLFVDTSAVESNMVFFKILKGSTITPEKLCQVLEKLGVLAMPSSPTSVRLVLHYQISDSDVQYALNCIKQAVQQLSNEAVLV